MKPTLFIIAGCNGAGKTTASYSVLPDLLECREFVNADEIASGLSPFKPEEVAIEAGKLMLKRINYLLSKSITFAIETTLSTKSYQQLITRAKESGYQVILLFFWLPDPEMARMRVKMRVESGGHNIPSDVINRRYWRGLENLFKIFIPIVDKWSLYDNSNSMQTIVDRNMIVNEKKLNKIKELCLNRMK